MPSRPTTPSSTLDTPTALSSPINRLSITSTNPLACLSTLPPELKALIVEHIYDLDTLSPDDDDEETDEDNDVTATLDAWEDEEMSDVGSENDDGEEDTYRLGDKRKPKWASKMEDLARRKLDGQDEQKAEGSKGGEAEKDSLDGWDSVSHEWEEYGNSRLPTLEAISRVSQEFADLAFPFLWKTVNLATASNLDYLYFLKVIIPRHGKHVVFLQNITPSFLPEQRPEVPPYITDALCMPPQLSSYDSSDDEESEQKKPKEPQEPQDYLNRMDKAYFVDGKEIFFVPGETLESHDEAQLWGSQRDQLLTSILDKEALPNLDVVHIDLQGDDYVLEETCKPLVDALSKRPELIEVALNAPGGEWEEAEEPFHLSEQWLHDFLGHFPNLIKLTVDFPPMAPYCRKELVERIAGMEKLERLVLRDAPYVSTSFAEADWKAPLKLLHLQDADLSLFEMNQLFGKIGKTLEILDIDEVPNSDLNRESKRIFGKPFPLPKLHTLVLATLLDPTFLTSFSACPIEELEIGECPLIKYADWEAFLDLHRSTLKSLRLGSQALFTDAEKESIELLCFSRQVDFVAEEASDESDLGESDEEGFIWSGDEDIDEEEDEGDWGTEGSEDEDDEEAEEF